VARPLTARRRVCEFRARLLRSRPRNGQTLVLARRECHLERNDELMQRGAKEAGPLF